MPFGGLLTAGILGFGGSLFSGIMGSNAAKSASGQQVAAENQALDFQKQIWAQEQQNLAPWLSAGSTSIADLIAALKSGKFGAGSNGAIPTFTAPTLEQAQATPGYQFTAQQGSKGILEGAGAAGGAISGGTLRALDQFNTNLANTTYGDVFNRAMGTYGANLQGYQLNLAKQAQEFSQMFAPAQLGEQATAALNSQGQNASLNIAQLMAGIGNAQAAGTVGSTNALTSGISGGLNSLMQVLLLNKVLNPSVAPGAPAPGGYGSYNPSSGDFNYNPYNPGGPPINYGEGPG